MDLISKNGSVAEWLKAHAWKACGVKAPAGSNPVTSAFCTGSISARARDAPGFRIAPAGHIKSNGITSGLRFRFEVTPEGAK